MAIRPSTGEVLAAASGPGGGGLSTATAGRYAPGSTFKIATALALLRAGATPDSTLACPPTITADGRTFQNFPGYPATALGDITLRTAIANSCNTAFIGGRDTVAQAALAEAAGSLGLAQSGRRRLPAFLGSVPSEAEGTEHAASMIGQGQGAGVTAGDGDRRGVGRERAQRPSGRSSSTTPRCPARPRPCARPLDPAEAATLHELMRGVVTEGSGRLPRRRARVPRSGRRAAPRSSGPTTRPATTRG